MRKMLYLKTNENIHESEKMFSALSKIPKAYNLHVPKLVIAFEKINLYSGWTRANEHATRFYKFMGFGHNYLSKQFFTGKEYFRLR